MSDNKELKDVSPADALEYLNAKVEILSEAYKGKHGASAFDAIKGRTSSVVASPSDLVDSVKAMPIPAAITNDLDIGIIQAARTVTALHGAINKIESKNEHTTAGTREPKFDGDTLDRAYEIARVGENQRRMLVAQDVQALEAIVAKGAEKETKSVANYRMIEGMSKSGYAATAKAEKESAPKGTGIS